MLSERYTGSHQAAEAPPARVLHISSLVNEREALLFDRYVESLHKLSSMHKTFIEFDCDKITDVAKRIFGHKTTTEICGSYSKGTNIAGSDLDFYVDTAYPVTKESQLRFVTALKEYFNDENICMGRLAIHISTEFVDIDVVCSNTVEYGVRPRPNAKVSESAIVQYAARGLKEWAKHNIVGKLKGFLIEDMALKISTSYSLPDACLGKGGLQLFLSVIQTMLDSEHSGTGIFGLQGGSGAAKHLREAAKLTVQQFLLARPTRGGFHSVAEIALWICSVRDRNVNTSCGPLFDWMTLSNLEDVGPASLCRSIIHLFSPSNEPNHYPIDVSIDSHAFSLLKASPYACYLLISEHGLNINAEIQQKDSIHNDKIIKQTIQSKRKKNKKHSSTERPTNKSNSSPDSTKFVDLTQILTSNISSLCNLSNNGSYLATFMIEIRGQWMYGEQKLQEANYEEAIHHFAESVRKASIHSDPFSGIFSLGNMNIYHEAVENVLLKDNANDDAVLVKALLLVCRHDLGNAISLLQERINQGSVDHLGILYTCACLYGSSNKWDNALRIFKRCVDLDPLEGIFYYWVGINMKNTMSITPSVTAIGDIIENFEIFLQDANEEGRKYAQAWYEIIFWKCILLSMSDGHSQLSLRKEIINDFKEAQEAERLRLPFFPPLSCHAKDFVLKFIPTLHTGDKFSKSSKLSSQGEDEMENQKNIANQLFKQHQYHEAISIYSELIDEDPSNLKVRSNRIAAYCALGFFTEAIQDAKKLLSIDQNWAKGYYRLGVSFMGNCQFQEAKHSFEQASRLVPTDSDVLRKLKDCEAELQQEEVPGQNSQFEIPTDLTLLPCYSKIKHLSSVKFVDSRGNGDYRSVSDAIHANRHHSALTIVLFPGIHLDQIDLTYFNKLELMEVQILGWFPQQPRESVVGGREDTNVAEDVSRKPQSEIRGFTNEEQAKGRHFNTNTNFTLIMAMSDLISLDIEDVNLTQPIGLPHTYSGACIVLDHGSQVRVRNSNMRTPSSPCLSVAREKTLLSIDNCSFRDVSAAVVVAYGGRANIQNCFISGSLKAAVEVRTGGICDIENSRFSRCSKQAVSICNHGAKLTISHCSFWYCGNRHGASVILVEDGTTTIRNCDFKKNTGDGIIVQQTQVVNSVSSPPVVFIQSCSIENGPVGIGFYYGSGMILDNTVTGCAGGGVSVRNLTPGKKLSFRGNKFHGNGRNSKFNWVIEGDTMFRNCVRILDDDSNRPTVVGDALCQIAHSMTQSKLASLGLR